MSDPSQVRAWVYVDWEPGEPPYLAVARPDAPVERLPLTQAGLLDLISQAATALRAGWGQGEICGIAPTDCRQKHREQNAI